MNDKLVLVTWNDAVEMEGGWHEIDTIKQHDLAVCKTVGWIVEQNDKQIIIMSTIEGDEYGGGVHAIPNDWCISIQPLTTYTSTHYNLEE